MHDPRLCDELLHVFPYLIFLSFFIVSAASVCILLALKTPQ